jgi:hypothetical protein
MNTRADSYESLFDRVGGQKPAAAAEEEASERFFGFVTGVQDRAHNIEFRKDGGAWPFLEYSYLIGGEAIHAGEFVLRFATGERVTVRGRNLRPLYEKLLRHRVTWVRDAVSDEKAPDGELFVDEIEGPVKVEEQDGAGAP